MKKVIFILLIAFTLFGCESQQERTNVTNPEVTLEESKFIADTLMHGYYKTQWKDGSKYIYYYNTQKEFTGRDEIFVLEVPYGLYIFLGIVITLAFIGILMSIFD
jgi:hypothetical protein